MVPLSISSATLITSARSESIAGDHSHHCRENAERKNGGFMCSAPEKCIYAFAIWNCMNQVFPYVPAPTNFMSIIDNIGYNYMEEYSQGV